MIVFLVNYHGLITKPWWLSHVGRVVPSCNASRQNYFLTIISKYTVRSSGNMLCLCLPLTDFYKKYYKHIYSPHISSYPLYIYICIYYKVKERLKKNPTSRIGMGCSIWRGKIFLWKIPRLFIYIIMGNSKFRQTKHSWCFCFQPIIFPFATKIWEFIAEIFARWVPLMNPLFLLWPMTALSFRGVFQ